MIDRALRIVSLLPSATEIAVALGLGDNLVGRSHECDFPPGIDRLPVVTSTKLEKGLGSRAIDDRVQAIVRQGLSVYNVDADLLRELAPDVILTQSQCAVCAVTPIDLENALGAWVGTAPTLVSLAPDDLDQVWDSFCTVGDATGARAAAERAVRDLRERMDGVGQRRRFSDAAPTMAAIEWMDPLMVAGNWIPELIRLAGATPLLARAGEHSDWLEWSALADADPDIIVLMPCGYQLDQTLVDLPALQKRQEWTRLRAVQAGNVAIVDGHHYYNRPGPRLVESTQLLGQIADCFVSRECTNGDALMWLSDQLSVA